MKMLLSSAIALALTAGTIAAPVSALANTRASATDISLGGASTASAAMVFDHWEEEDDEEGAAIWWFLGGAVGLSALFVLLSALGDDGEPAASPGT